MVYIDKQRITSYKTDILKVAQKLEELTIISEEEFMEDDKLILSLRYLIIEVVEAMANIGKHLLAKLALKAVEEYKDCFRELGKARVVTKELSTSLIGLAGLRNLLVHRYWEIDDCKVFLESKDGIKDFYEFLRQVDVLIEKYPDLP